MVSRLRVVPRPNSRLTLGFQPSPSARMPIHRPTAPTMIASQMRAETNQSFGGPTLAGTYHGGR